MTPPHNEDFHYPISERNERAATIAASDLDFSAWATPSTVDCWAALPDPSDMARIASSLTATAIALQKRQPQSHQKSLEE